jgi:hypothetical protein
MSMEQVPDAGETPRQALWTDLADFERLDGRVSAVTALFGSVIGVNEGYVEWCPDALPPKEQ